MWHGLRVRVSTCACADPFCCHIMWTAAAVSVAGLKDCSPSSDAVIARQPAFHAGRNVIIHILRSVVFCCSETRPSAVFVIPAADLAESQSFCITLPIICRCAWNTLARKKLTLVVGYTETICCLQTVTHSGCNHLIATLPRVEPQTSCS